MATSGFTNTHRLFLQAAISKRLMTEATALDLYSQDNFSDFVGQLNEGLNSVELEFRRAQDEVSGAFVMALFDAIVMADDEAFCISSTAALHEAGKLKNKENKPLALSKKDAESLLDRFVKDQWLIRSAAGAYSLSMRSLLELQTYLKETYDDQIQECTLCMEIVTKGQRCVVAACSCRLHNHCAGTYFGNMNKPVCPTCSSAWTGRTLIGLSDRTAAPSTVRRRRRRREDGGAEVGEDGGQDENGGDEEEDA
ncbi:hypothetical protein BG011_001252 [Mortierella polycephala]|uniref:Non-structural maintenance of chromosomes element 1 homolog n=1 Tax=Mortierella polycephala TaxID=41804 RepID=A0A9P6U613_9FUNG|nr:hypothetical protein BG011_001252 [Mortierella polycephala]